MEAATFFNLCCNTKCVIHVQDAWLVWSQCLALNIDVCGELWYGRGVMFVYNLEPHCQDVNGLQDYTRLSCLYQALPGQINTLIRME